MFLDRAATPEWRNTLSFLFGRVVGTFTEPKKAIELLESCLAGATAVDTGLLPVLADATQVLTGKGITLRTDSLRQLQRVLLDAMAGPRRWPSARPRVCARPPRRSTVPGGSVVAARRGAARVHQGRGGSVHDGERLWTDDSLRKSNSRSTSSSCPITSCRGIR